MLTSHPSWDVTSQEAHVCRMALRCAPGGGLAQRIGHAGRVQRFDVLQGAMLADVDGAIRVVRAGEHLTVPAGAKHRWAVHGTEELVCAVEVRAG